MKLTLDSTPSGASVIGPDGKELGKTPITVEWPASTAPLPLVFKLKGYRDKPVQLDVSANTATRAELMKLRTVPKDSKTPTDPEPTNVKGMTGKDGLERPD